MTASAEGRLPDEKRRITVSERSVSALAGRLTGWLADRLGDAEPAAGRLGDAEPAAGRRWRPGCRSV